MPAGCENANLPCWSDLGVKRPEVMFSRLTMSQVRLCEALRCRVLRFRCSCSVGGGTGYRHLQSSFLILWVSFSACWFVLFLLISLPLSVSLSLSLSLYPLCSVSLLSRPSLLSPSVLVLVLLSFLLSLSFSLSLSLSSAFACVCVSLWLDPPYSRPDVWRLPPRCASRDQILTSFPASPN